MLDKTSGLVIPVINGTDSMTLSEICDARTEIVEKARQIWKGTTYAIDDITCVVAFFDKI